MHIIILPTHLTANLIYISNFTCLEQTPDHLLKICVSCSLLC